MSVIFPPLATPVTVANGGTNSTTTLNSNRAIVSVAGALTEAGAMTSARVICADTNGLPTTAPAAQVSLSKPLAFVTTTDGIVGTTTNDSATAGNVGQYLSSSITNTLWAVGTGVWADATSLALAAGDWDVTVVGAVVINGATATDFFVGASVTTGNSSTGLTTGDTMANALISTSSNIETSVPNIRFSLASLTTIYLKYMGDYSAGTPKIYARISARRMR